jgi:tRNA threonylcarbamoyl adenosine modification protein YeaZ
LLGDDGLIAGDCRLLGRGHAEHLIPMIADLPGRGRADRIAVSLGPGSFTGVRIGLAAARALALAWQVPALGYPTLALIAAMARDQRGEQPVTVATTGGHGEWFVQSFDEQGSPASDLTSLVPEEAARIAGPALVAGSQAEALVALRGSGNALAVWPDARYFGLLQESVLLPAGAPVYGRGPDARLPSGKP